MDRTELHINHNPILSTYPEYGSLFSILDTGDELTMDWLACSFLHIHVIRTEGGNGYFTCYPEHFTLRESVPVVQYYRIPWEALPGPDAAGAASQFLAAGYYITCLLDHYYVSAMPDWHKNHYFHLCFLYGCDRERQVFFLREYSDAGIYGQFECRFDEFKQSYRYCCSNGHTVNQENPRSITLLQHRRDIPYGLNLSYLLDELRSYRSSDHGENSRGAESPFHFELHRNGAPAYRDLGIYSLMEEKTDRLTQHPFHLFAEQKRLMCLRVSHLQKKGYLSDNKALDAFGQLADMAETLIGRYFHCRLNGFSPVEQQKLSRFLHEMHRQETAALDLLIAQLSRCLSVKPIPETK